MSHRSLLKSATHGAAKQRQQQQQAQEQDQLSNVGASTSSSHSPSPTLDAGDKTSFIDQSDFIAFDMDDDEDGARSGTNDEAAESDASTPGKKRGGKRSRDDMSDSPASGKGSAAKKRRGAAAGGARSPLVELGGMEHERCAPWADSLRSSGVLDKASDASELVNLDARAFVAHVSPTRAEHALRTHVVALIQRAITARWQNAQVKVFGSVATGLYLPGGDIDLVVLSPSMPAPPLKASVKLLRAIASVLISSRIAKPSSVVVISKARVPIIKFETIHGNFQVDISVNQVNGIGALEKVRDMLDRYSFLPATSEAKATTSEESEVDGEHGEIARQQHGVARSLVLLVKSLLKQRGMNEVYTGGLGSYAIICLVISFLQLHPKIQSGLIDPSEHVGVLFVEFLELYGKHFNYDEVGIVVKGEGGYFKKQRKGWYRPQQPYLLSIEDPNDPTNDVSGGSHNIIRVRQTFAGAFETLTATLFQRASVISSRRNPQAGAPLSARSLPCADGGALDALRRSVLASVISMTRGDVARREANVALHEDGNVQDLLLSPAPALLAAGQKPGKEARRAMKDAKRAKREEKTALRLAAKRDKREQRAQKREDRIKRATQANRQIAATLAGKTGGISHNSKEPIVLDDDDLAALAGEGSPALGDDNADESRYSVKSAPAKAKAKKGKKAAAAAVGVIEVSSDDHHKLDGNGAIEIPSDSSSDDDDDDDDDDDGVDNLTGLPSSKAAYWASKGGRRK